MTEEEKKKARTTGGYASTIRLSKKKQPLQPSPSCKVDRSAPVGQIRSSPPGTIQIIEYQPHEVQPVEPHQATSVQCTAFPSSEVEPDNDDVSFIGQAPDGSDVNEINKAASCINSVNQPFNLDVQKLSEGQGISAKHPHYETQHKIVRSQVPQAESTHQAQSCSPPPRYPLPSENQQLNPSLAVNGLEGSPYDGLHHEFELNDKVDVVMHDAQQERHNNAMTAALEEWEAVLQERDAAIQERHAELDSREEKIKMKETRNQEIENVLQDWQTDLQERAADMDTREAAFQKAL